MKERKPKRWMLRLIKYRYIHVPHGITDNSPHTHLWDRLNWEWVELDLRHAQGYYDLVISQNPEWKKAFWEMIDGTGNEVEYHSHGTIWGKSHDMYSIFAPMYKREREEAIEKIPLLVAGLILYIVWGYLLIKL